MEITQGSTQTGCGYFQWYYDDVVDEKDQFMKKQKGRLDKMQTELDAAKLELLSLKATNDGLKQKILELQMQIKTMMNSEKKYKRILCIVLLFVIWKML